MSKVTETQKEKIIELYQSTDLTYEEIGNLCNLVKGTISKVIRAHGLPPRASRIEKITPEIIEDYLSGISITQLEKIHNVSRPTLSKLLKKNNIEVLQPKSTPHEIQLEIIELYNSKKITVKDLAEKYDVIPCSIFNILRRNNISLTANHSFSNRIYPLDEHYFDEIDTHDKAQFLGLLYADGNNCPSNNTISVGLIEPDKEYLEQFNQLFQPTKPLMFLKTAGRVCEKTGITCRHDAYRLSIASKHVLDAMTKWGVVQNKTFKIEWPEWLPEKFWGSFLLGYIEGDGHIGKDMFNIVGTLAFCQRVKEIIFEKFNEDSYLCQQNNVFCLVFCGRIKTMKILKWVYENSNIRMQRKYVKYLNMVNRKMKNYFCNENGDRFTPEERKERRRLKTLEYSKRAYQKKKDLKLKFESETSINWQSQLPEPPSSPTSEGPEFP